MCEVLLILLGMDERAAWQTEEIVPEFVQDVHFGMEVSNELSTFLVLVLYSSINYFCMLHLHLVIWKMLLSEATC